VTRQEPPHQAGFQGNLGRHAEFAGVDPDVLITLHDYRKSITLKISRTGVTFFLIGVSIIIFTISHGAALASSKLLFPCISYAVPSCSSPSSSCSNVRTRTALGEQFPLNCRKLFKESP
jgi:hypothetical protein